MLNTHTHTHKRDLKGGGEREKNPSWNELRNDPVKQYFAAAAATPDAKFLSNFLSLVLVGKPIF